MSSPTLQLGVSHQTPATLTAPRMRFLRQMGVDNVEVRIPSSASGYDDICRVRDTVEGGGLGLHEIMLADRYSCRPIALGLPDSAVRDRPVQALHRRPRTRRRRHHDLRLAHRRRLHHRT